MSKIAKSLRVQAEVLEDAAANALDIQDEVTPGLRMIDERQDKLIETIRQNTGKPAIVLAAVDDFNKLEPYESNLFDLNDYKARKNNRLVVVARRITDSLSGLFRYREKDDRGEAA